MLLMNGGECHNAPPTTERVRLTTVRYYCHRLLVVCPVNGAAHTTSAKPRTFRNGTLDSAPTGQPNEPVRTYL